MIPGAMFVHYSLTFSLRRIVLSTPRSTKQFLAFGVSNYVVFRFSVCTVGRAHLVFPAVIAVKVIGF